MENILTNCLSVAGIAIMTIVAINASIEGDVSYLIVALAGGILCWGLFFRTAN